MQPLQFGDYQAHVVRLFRHFDLSDALHGHAERHRVHVRADPANALHQGDRFGNVFVLRQPLDAAEIKADFQRRANNGLALAFHFDLVWLLKREVIRTNGDTITHARAPFDASRMPGASVSRSISGGVDSRPSNTTAK